MRDAGCGVQALRFEVQDSRFKIQDSRFKILDSRFEIREVGAEGGFAVELGYIVGRFRTEGSSALIIIYPWISNL